MSFLAVLQLDERDRPRLNALPQEHFRECDTECPICKSAENPTVEDPVVAGIQEDYASLSVKTSCNHMFHMYCLYNWLGSQIQNDRQGTCPICRETLIDSAAQRTQREAVNQGGLAFDEGETFLSQREVVLTQHGAALAEEEALLNQDEALLDEHHTALDDVRRTSLNERRIDLNERRIVLNEHRTFFTQVRAALHQQGYANPGPSHDTTI
jgi:hypothetical protein